MKTTTLPTIRFILLLVAALPALLSATETKPEKTLDKGMETEAIRQMLGQPAEVIPMDSSDRKAERWIYRRKVKEYSTQVETGVTMVPAFKGNGGSGAPIIGDTPVPEYRLKHFKIIQVTALLIVDGKLELAKQWQEKEESFAD